jgi:hypothetical protein
MAKALRTVAVISAAVALTATGVGAAAGLGLGISAATAATASSVATYAGIASAVAGGLGQALTKEQNERAGQQLQFKINPGGPLSYVAGRVAVGGRLVHRETFGTDSSYQTQFVDLGTGGPYDAIEAFTADRATIPFSGTSALGYYANWMWSDRQVGLTPEPRALGSGVTNPPYGTAGPVPGWGAAHKMSGHAAASITYLYDTKGRRYGQGEPQPAWVVRGAKVYDPAQDSTYPGGSGPCRWADPSDTAAHAAARRTWVYSTSPALHGLMWRLGIWQRDETNPAARYQKVMGIGAPIDLIDLPAILHARNVQLANGWTIGAEITSDQDRWAVLKMIEEAGGCEPIANGALMSTLVKAPRVPLRTITAADLADGMLSAPAMRTRSERINGYRAKFRSEPHGWEEVPIDIVQMPAYVAADGRARTGSGTFSYVTDPDQCAELAAYQILDSREIDGITVPLKPFAVAYRLGDCLTLDLPEIGLEAREVIVRGRQVDPATGIVTLTCRTETAAKHPAALGLTGETPPTPTLTAPPDVIAPPSAGSWALAATSVDGGGLVQPALLVTGAVDNANADAIVMEHRAIGAAEWTGSSVLPPDTRSRVIAPMVAGVQYEVAVRYRGRGILSDRLVIGPVTADAVTIGGKSVTALVEAVDRAASDGWIVPAEKRQARIDFDALVTEWSDYRTLSGAYEAGDPELGAARVAADQAITALDGYLRFELTGWADAVDTQVEPAVYRAKWGDAYQRVTRLSTLLNTVLQGDIDQVRGRVDRVGSDGWVTTGEKPVEHRSFKAMVDQWVALRERAADGLEAANPAIGTARVAADSAMYALDTYLRGVLTGWDDVTVDTAVVPADYSATWSLAYERIADFNAAIVGQKGDTGQEGVTTSTVKRRSDAQPATPATGSGNPPAGWYIGLPDGTEPAWETSATFRGAEQLTDWTTPARISGPPGATADDLGLGARASGEAAITMGTSSNGSTIAVDHPVTLQAGRMLRVTLGAREVTKDAGTGNVSAGITVSIGGDTLFTGSVGITGTIEAPAIGVNTLPGASAKLVSNPVAGTANLVISYTRAGGPGNAGGFTLDWSLERV